MKYGHRFFSKKNLCFIFLPGLESRRRSELGCEGETVRVSCGEGERVRALRANFGRFARDVCSQGVGEEESAKWSVLCLQPRYKINQISLFE